LDKPSALVAFPVRIVYGAVATAQRVAHIRQMIEQVLFTMPGERVMYPDFGVGLERLVFETTGNEVMTATQSLVSAALQRWLGDVISVREVKLNVNDATVSIDVLYELVDTRETQSETFQL
jgi:phage baseplate assembly protein W